jgi:hypothetical protein
MAAFNKINSFVEAVAEKVHNLGADSIKVMLTNTAPLATNTVFANLVDLATAGGYTAGGNVCAITSSVQTAGTYKLILVDSVFTATTGFGPFRYAVLYNDTALNKELIGWYDYGSAVTLLALETFIVDFDGAAGVLTIA